MLSSSVIEVNRQEEDVHVIPGEARQAVLVCSSGDPKRGTSKGLLQSSIKSRCRIAIVDVATLYDNFTLIQ
mgnify:CR=1 FL=1